MHVLRIKNRTAERPANREAAIPIEAARVCSVCWTVHQADECPECKARQWQGLLELMEALGLEPWTAAGKASECARDGGARKGPAGMAAT